MDQNKEVEVLVRLGRVEDLLNAGFESQKKANENLDRSGSQLEDQIEKLSERVDVLEKWKVTIGVWLSVGSVVITVVWSALQWFFLHQK